MPNLFEDEFTGRLDLSSEETAMYLYDIQPGDWLPYHYEHVEEWLLVVEGVVVVRVPDGEDELDRGALMRFAAGPDGAHQVSNRGTAKARVLLFSKAALPGISVCPDTDTIGVWPTTTRSITSSETLPSHARTRSNSRPSQKPRPQKDWP